MKYSKDFYQKIIEASHDEICVSDKNGVIIFCNKSFEENYGISKSEMLGKNVEYLEKLNEYIEKEFKYKLDKPEMIYILLHLTKIL